MLHRHRIPATGSDETHWTSWAEDLGAHVHTVTIGGIEAITSTSFGPDTHAHAIVHPQGVGVGTTSLPYYDHPDDGSGAIVPAAVQILNRVRCERWHGVDDDWTLGDWANAFQGEAGELGNVVKKMRRHALGVATTYNTPELDELRARFAEEVADVRLYLDLLCWKAGVSDADLDTALIAKFNQVSLIQGWGDLLVPEADPS